MPSSTYRKRQPRAVPSLTRHPLYPIIKSCTACDLYQSCTAPVPGVGPERAEVMLVLEAPGETEDLFSIPATGATWEELQPHLATAYLERDQVYITNTLHCFTKDPTLKQAQVCADVWLEAEIAMVQPRIIMAMGQIAIRVLLNDPTLTVEEMHGYPVWKPEWNAWVLPAYHPAAAFYNGAVPAYLQQDMLSLKDLMAGKVRERPTDPWHGRELYSDVQGEQQERQVREWAKDIALSNTPVAVDTETRPDGSLWCASVSTGEGTGLVVMENQLSLLAPIFLNRDTPLVFHNALYDLNALWAAGVTIRNSVIHDTLTMTRLLQLESGRLKDLARRLLGMEMRDYPEVIGDAQIPLSLDYLQRAHEIALTLPNPAPREELVWDGKAGELIPKVKKPQPLHKKITRLIKDLEARKVDKDGQITDSVKRWKEWRDDGETAEVEAMLGVFPRAYLEHVEREKAIFYAARDADSTLRLFPILHSHLVRANLLDVYGDIDTPAFPLIADMVRSGLKIDQPFLSRLESEWTEQRESSLVECWSAVGKMFSPASSIQTARVLFTDLGLPAGRTTATGLDSTDDAILIPLKGLHPIVPPILEVRELDKLLNTYVLPYPKLADREGRVHTDYGGMTITGRYAAKNPNVMAAPKRSKRGKQFRSAFVPADGFTYLSADYSQIEMRLLAHAAEDLPLLEAFWSGSDVHTANASVIYNVPYEQVTEAQRTPAKNVGFGVVYCIEAQGLLVQLKQRADFWTIEMAQELLNAYRKAHPGVTQYQERQRNYARRYGYVTDMFGRRRLLPAIHSPRYSTRSEAERHAVNFPIQAGATGIIKLAMAEIWRRTEDAREFQHISQHKIWREVKHCLQVHDQLVAEVRDELRLEVGEDMRQVMESRVQLLVPTLVDVQYGKRLGELEG